MSVANGDNVNLLNESSSTKTIPPAFPTDALCTLNLLVHRQDGKVPVLPNSHLEVLLVASINLAKLDQDFQCPECVQFYDNSLLASFSKIFLDDSHFIYTNALLAIELCAIKTGSDCISLLQLQSILLNRNSRFLLRLTTNRNVRLPVQGSSISQFTEITNILPHLGGSAVDLKKFSHSAEGCETVLDDFIDLFGRLNGFEKIRQRFANGECVSIELIYAYLHPFSHCAEFIDPGVIREYLVPIINIALDLFKTTTDVELKFRPKDSKHDLFVLFSNCFFTLLSRSNVCADELERFEMVLYNTLLRMFKTSSFNGKMTCLNNLNCLLSFINSTCIGKWMKEEKVLETLLRENLHQPQYVEKVEDIIRFMVTKHFLTLADVGFIWEIQKGKHETIVKNIFNMLSRLSCYFSSDQLNYLFIQLQRSWDEATKRQRERLIELIPLLTDQDKEGLMVQKVLDLLWEWATYKDLSPDLMQAALKSHVMLLVYNSKSSINIHQIWLVKLARMFECPLSPSSCLLQAAKLFVAIISDLTMIQYQEYVNMVNMVRQLNETYHIFERAFECIIHTLALMHQERLDVLKGLNDSDPFPLHRPINGPRDKSHLLLIQSLLKLLRLLIVKFGSEISFVMLQQMWHAFCQPILYPTDLTDPTEHGHAVVVDGRSSGGDSDDAAATRLVNNHDRDLCLRWFIWLMKNHWLIHRDFLWFIFLTLDPQHLTKTAFGFTCCLYEQITLDSTCFIEEFQKVCTQPPPSPLCAWNSTERQLVADDNTDDVVVKKFVTLAPLWKFAMYSATSMSKLSTKLLLQLYNEFYRFLLYNRSQVYFKDEVLNQSCILYETTLVTCFSHLHSAYCDISKLIEKLTPYKEKLSKNSQIQHILCPVLRVLRILKRLSISSFDEASHLDHLYALPLMNRSWTGSSFIFNVTLQLTAQSSLSYTTWMPNSHKYTSFKFAVLTHANQTIASLRRLVLHLALIRMHSVKKHHQMMAASSNMQSLPMEQLDDCVNSDNASQYRMELYVKIRAKYGGRIYALNPNVDQQPLVYVLEFIPSWARCLRSAMASSCKLSANAVGIELIGKLDRVCYPTEHNIYNGSKYFLRQTNDEASVDGAKLTHHAKDDFLFRSKLSSYPNEPMTDDHYSGNRVVADESLYCDDQSRSDVVSIIDPFAKRFNVFANERVVGSTVDQQLSDWQGGNKTEVVYDLEEEEADKLKNVNDDDDDDDDDGDDEFCKKNVDFFYYPFKNEVDETKVPSNTDDGIEFLLNFGRVAYKIGDLGLWNGIYQVLQNLTTNDWLRTSIKNLGCCPNLNDSWLGKLLITGCPIDTPSNNKNATSVDDVDNPMELLYVLQTLYAMCLPATSLFCPVRLDTSNQFNADEDDDSWRLTNEPSAFIQFITKHRKNKYNWWPTKSGVWLTLQLLRAGIVPLLFSSIMFYPDNPNHTMPCSSPFRRKVTHHIRLWMLRLLRLFLFCSTYTLRRLTQLDRAFDAFVKSTERLALTPHPILSGTCFLLFHADLVSRKAIGTGTTFHEFRSCWFRDNNDWLSKIWQVALEPLGKISSTGKSNLECDVANVNFDCQGSSRRRHHQHHRRRRYNPIRTTCDSKPSQSKFWTPANADFMCQTSNISLNSHSSTTSTAGSSKVTSPFGSLSAHSSRISSFLTSFASSQQSLSSRDPSLALSTSAAAAAASSSSSTTNSSSLSSNLCLPRYPTNKLNNSINKQCFQFVQSSWTDGCVCLEALWLIPLLRGIELATMKADDIVWAPLDNRFHVLLLSRSILVRLTSSHFVYSTLMLSPDNLREKLIYQLIKQLFGWVQTHVLLNINKSDECFKLITRLIPLIKTNEEFVVEARKWFNHEIEWLRSMILDRKCDRTQPMSSVLNLTKSKFLKIFDALRSPFSTCSLALSNVDSVKLIVSLHSIRQRDLVISGHLTICIEILRLLSAGPDNAKDNASQPADIKRFFDEIKLARDMIILLLFPASKQFMLANLYLNRDYLSPEHTEVRLLPASSLSVCSNILIHHSFAFLIGLSEHNLDIKSLLTTSLYDLLFSELIDLPDFKWDYGLSNGCDNLSDRHDRSSSNSHPHFVGLKNAGATCYMNSIVQQLFSIEPIRNAVLHIQIPWEYLAQLNPKSTEANPTVVPSTAKLTAEQLYHLQVVIHIQIIFGHLAYGQMKSYLPADFCRQFRIRNEVVHVRDQHDAMEFFQVLCDNLNESLALCKLPKMVELVLGGEFADQKICLDCPHRYTSYEAFTSLNLDVFGHRDLSEALEQYVKGELLEGDNAYYCHKCDRKIAILKRMCLQKLPLILGIQLKRFDYDWDRGQSIKYNNYCAFPCELDMSAYTVQGLPDPKRKDGDEGEEEEEATADNPTVTDNPNPCTTYTLRGVVVHSGQASSGHYYSFIRYLNKSNKTYQWYKFDDNVVTPVKMMKEEDMAEKWFGGDLPASDYIRISSSKDGKKWWSAYLLFYERNDFNEQCQKFQLPTSDGTLTPRVYEMVNYCNIENLHRNMQFSSMLLGFVYQLIDKNVTYCLANPSNTCNLAFGSSNLLVNFMRLRYRAVASNWKLWLNLFFKLASIGSEVRADLIKRLFFTSIDQVPTILLECPLPEIRFIYASLLVYLSHLCTRQSDQISTAHLFDNFASCPIGCPLPPVPIRQLVASSPSQSCWPIDVDLQDCQTIPIGRTLSSRLYLENLNLQAAHVAIGNETSTINPGHCLIQLLLHQLYYSAGTMVAFCVYKQPIQMHCFDVPHWNDDDDDDDDGSGGGDDDDDDEDDDDDGGEQQRQGVNRRIRGEYVSTSRGLAAYPSSATYYVSNANTDMSNLVALSNWGQTQLNNNTTNRSSCSGGGSSNKPKYPTPLIWAQYVAILVDYAKLGNVQCQYLVDSRAVEFLLQYVLRHEVCFTTLDFSTSKPLQSKTGDQSSQFYPHQQLSYNFANYGLWSPDTHDLTLIRRNEESNYEQFMLGLQSILLDCEKDIFLNESIQVLIHSLFAVGSLSGVKNRQSNAYLNMSTQYLYDYNKLDNPTSYPIIILLHSGVQMVFELVSYVIRTYELPMEYYYNQSQSSSAINQSDVNRDLIGRNPYRIITQSTSNGLLPTSMIRLLCWNRTVKQVIRNLLSSLTVKPLSEIFMFLSYEHPVFSNKLLKQLVLSMFCPFHIDSLLNLIQIILEMDDSVKPYRMLMFLKYCERCDLLNTLKSQFLFVDTNIVVYKFLEFFVRLLCLPNSQLHIRLAQDIPTAKVLYDVFIVATNKLKGSNKTWLTIDDVIEDYAKVVEIFKELIPSDDVELTADFLNDASSEQHDKNGDDDEEEEEEEEEDDDDGEEEDVDSEALSILYDNAAGGHTYYLDNPSSDW